MEINKGWIPFSTLDALRKRIIDSAKSLPRKGDEPISRKIRKGLRIFSSIDGSEYYSPNLEYAKR